MTCGIARLQVLQIRTTELLNDKMLRRNNAILRSATVRYGINAASR